MRTDDGRHDQSGPLQVEYENTVSAILFCYRDLVTQSELEVGHEGVEEESGRGITQRQRGLWLQLMHYTLARALPSDLEGDLERGNGGRVREQVDFHTEGLLL